ncbi:tissue factor pathway inhibitor-like [Pectinophora gossypiella]|uniref:tissue factor pathway inhibitor-like n=1 Tax=Pectinophora gossypiella TaxID=13191 RepID=UPI00214EB4BA|nr:tissue factor pathway inhibitor-like [Pectinophora gossypiella]
MYRKWYYDLKLQDCKETEIGKCANNFNSFSNKKACRDQCQDAGKQEFKTRVTPKIYCTFQQDFGDCNTYYPKFYFDITHRECRGFSYSGCGGNLNRFATFQVCSAICMPLVEYKLDEDVKDVGQQRATLFSILFG